MMFSFSTKALLVVCATFLFTPAPNDLGEDINNTDELACRVQLTGLKCLEMEGFMWPDAIYFKISGNGETIEWPARRFKMSSGDFLDLRSQTPIPLDGTINFQMWDDDANDPDDDLGTDSISCNDAGFGEKYLSFTQDGAHYRLYYIVK